MQGFLSYAPSDLDAVQTLLPQLRRVAQEHGIEFWWPDQMRTAAPTADRALAQIARSDVIILFVSNAYLASDQIRDTEQPAITARYRSAGSVFIITVILEPCSWTKTFPLQPIVPVTTSGQLLPISEWKPPSVGFVQAGELIAQAIRHFVSNNQTPTDPEAAERQRHAATLSALTPSSPGATWVEQDDQFVKHSTVTESDSAFAALPQTATRHASILARARAFTDRTARTRNTLGWEELDAAARAFASAIDAPTTELPARLETVWESLVSLATYIDQDNDLRATPHDAMEPLAPDLRRQFNELLVVSAPWLRGFATAQKLDDEAGAFLLRLDLHGPAREVLNRARDEGIIRAEDADAELSMLDHAERGNQQARKASARGIFSARNLLYAMARKMGETVVLAAVVNAWANESALMKSVGRTLASLEQPIAALIADAPNDIRHALGWLTEEIGKAKPPRPPRPPSRKREEDDPPSDPTNPPPDFSQEEAERRILAGTALPPVWRPFITQLGFGRYGWRENGYLERRDGDYQHEIDLRLLAGLPNLQRLALTGMAIADLAPLANLANLQELFLSNTQAADLAPLASLANLQHLDLSNTQAADLAPLAPLASLANLQRLDLSHTQAADLAPLASLVNLQYLYLSNTQAADLTPLASLANLQYLNLSNTQAADLAPLAGLAKLEWLDLEGTPVTDLAPLASLPALRHLDITGVQADLTSIAREGLDIVTGDKRRRSRRGRRGGRRLRRDS